MNCMDCGAEDMEALATGWHCPKCRSIFPHHKDKQMRELFLFTAIEPTFGQEAMIGIPSRPGQPPVPAVGPDEARIMELIPLAQEIANHNKIEISLYRYTTRKLVKVVRPQ